MKKPNKQAAISVLPFARKDEEVAEYAFSRTLFPALIADEQTQLPNNALFAKPGCMRCMRKTRRLMR